MIEQRVAIQGGYSILFSDASEDSGITSIHIERENAVKLASLTKGANGFSYDAKPLGQQSYQVPPGSGDKMAQYFKTLETHYTNSDPALAHAYGILHTYALNNLDPSLDLAAICGVNEADGRLSRDRSFGSESTTSTLLSDMSDRVDQVNKAFDTADRRAQGYERDEAPEPAAKKQKRGIFSLFKRHTDKDKPRNKDKENERDVNKNKGSEPLAHPKRAKGDKRRKPPTRHK